MKVGIIGYTGAGRSTVFDALSGKKGTPLSPGKTRLGVAPVLDPRLDALTALYKPRRTVHAEVSLALPPNATAGPLDAPLVREMRDLRAYAHVIGAFGGDEPADEKAARQITELSTELVLTDMERVEKRQARIAKGGGARPGEEDALKRAATQLDLEQPLRLQDWEEGHLLLLNDIGLMSQRHLLTVVNVPEDLAGSTPGKASTAAAEATGSGLLWLCASLEAEIAALAADARLEFLEAYGLEQPVASRFVQAALSLLDQICFFTVGPDEVRAWPIARNSVALRAARAIHTDLERGFIRAEVVSHDLLLELGSEAKCRSEGKLRMEGKEYVVQDGDVITIRFNV